MLPCWDAALCTALISEFSHELVKEKPLDSSSPRALRCVGSHHHGHARTRNAIEPRGAARQPGRTMMPTFVSACRVPAFAAGAHASSCSGKRARSRGRWTILDTCYSVGNLVNVRLSAGRHKKIWLELRRKRSWARPLFFSFFIFKKIQIFKNIRRFQKISKMDPCRPWGATDPLSPRQWATETFL